MADEETQPTSGGADFWHEQIRLASKVEREWREDRAPKVVERYRDEKRKGGTRLNIFWANVQLLKPSVYSQRPRPDVRRRNVREEEPLQIVGRQVAQVLERALSFAIDDGFDAVMKSIRDDLLIPGRGVAREVYEPEIVRRPADMTMGETGDGIDEATGEPFVEEIGDERVRTEYVFWSDFRMSPARRWSDVWWIAFRHAMNKAALAEEFGPDLAQRVPMNLKGDLGEHSEDKTIDDPESREKRAEVWEIWNKRNRERVWVAAGFNEKLRLDADPLVLKDFFPCPAPLYVIETTDTMVPIPEFTMYQDQADELDEIQDRLTSLNRIAKALSIVDGDFTEIRDVKNAEDGDLIPITRPGGMAEDLRGKIWDWPIGNVVNAISILSQRAEQVKQGIFEITGLSDLSRGIAKPRVSATAESATARFGAVRMTPRSEPMQSYIRDLLRIKAEIMAEMFQKETLQRQAGIQVTPDMEMLMREERLRNTVIDIETDSTVLPDAQADKQEAVEYVQAVTAFFQQAVPLAQASPAMVPFLFELVKAASKPYKFSRKLEDSLEQASRAVMAGLQQQQATGAQPNGAGQSNGAGSEQQRAA